MSRGGNAGFYVLSWPKNVERLGILSMCCGRLRDGKANDTVDTRSRDRVCASQLSGSVSHFLTLNPRSSQPQRSALAQIV